MVDAQTQILLKTLPFLSKITGGYSTLTNSKGEMITNYDYKGIEINDYKGQVYQMAINCLKERKPLIGPAHYDPNSTALAIPIGNNVLVSTDTQRIRSDQHLKDTLINALPYISRLVGGTVSLCNRLGEYIISCDSNGNQITLPVKSTTAKKAVETMEPVIQMSRSMEGVQNAYIPITQDCCLKLNNATTVAKSSKLLEEVQKLRNTRYNFSDIIGNSPAMQETISKSKKISDSHSTVMLVGETGTGKELFAQSIHNFSPRKDHPFIAINCAALPASLIESHLFGYEDGAFTGAKKGGMPGAFEQAHKGTIFLDEISEMDFNSQSKLLRVLQEKEVTRIGSSRSIPIDVRIICATNRNLPDMVGQNKFRQDLYYRLNVIHIDIPPLRNRKGDPLLLSRYFLKKFGLQMGKAFVDIDDEVSNILQAYEWPGNVRELENIMEYAINMIDHSESIINISHLPINIASKTQVNMLNIDDSNKSLKEYVEDYEKEIIKRMMVKFHNDNHLVAKELDLSYTTLWRKIKKYDLD